MGILPFAAAATWQEKVFEADNIWTQLKSGLSANNSSLPQTPRRPDIRMVLNNNCGDDIFFQNPGDHSSALEKIPSEGDKTAAMVMFKGDTLDEQYQNAKRVSELYDLENQGFSPALLHALETGELANLVSEAYGPTSYDDQVAKFDMVEWDTQAGTSAIEPITGKAASFGARPPISEKVFKVDIPLAVKGTHTVPEFIESLGIYVAVSEDWETGEESTRPIASGVAREFYGEYFKSIPEVKLDVAGQIQSIDLKAGRGIEADIHASRENNIKPG